MKENIGQKTFQSKGISVRDNPRLVENNDLQSAPGAPPKFVPLSWATFKSEGEEGSRRDLIAPAPFLRDVAGLLAAWKLCWESHGTRPRGRAPETQKLSAGIEGCTVPPGRRRQGLSPGSEVGQRISRKNFNGTLAVRNPDPC